MLRTSVRALYQIRKVGELVPNLFRVPPRLKYISIILLRIQMIYDDFVVLLSSFWQMKRMEYFIVC